jgi:hypothetical protein
MRRLLLVVAMLLVGCSGGKEEEPAEDAEYAPIGPGSDSSALIPPDTPESRTGESSKQMLPPRDSL